MIQTFEHHHGAMVEIKLNDPPGNILTLKMMKEIFSSLEKFKSQPHIKLIVFSSEGKHFSFGASVEEHSSKEVTHMLPYFHKFIECVLTYPIPTLAKVQGVSLGGGLELALACSFIVATPKAKFGVPEIGLGVFPPVAAILLPWRVGDQGATHMILSGETLGAEHPLFSRIVTATVENIDEGVHQYFEKSFKDKSASSIRWAHKASRHLVCQSYFQYIERLESLYLNDLMSTDDAKEGIEAFIAKRKPVWKNS